ncbi:hypothetical protein V6615_12490 [Oscillospiraceae bacterium PP1C4]
MRARKSKACRATTAKPLSPGPIPGGASKENPSSKDGRFLRARKSKACRATTAKPLSPGSIPGGASKGSRSSKDGRFFCVLQIQGVQGNNCKTINLAGVWTRSGKYN